MAHVWLAPWLLTIAVYKPLGAAVGVELADAPNDGDTEPELELDAVWVDVRVALGGIVGVIVEEVVNDRVRVTEAVTDGEVSIKGGEFNCPAPVPLPN